MRKPRHREAKGPEKTTVVIGTRVSIKNQAAESRQPRKDECHYWMCPRPSGIALASESQGT